MIATLLLLGAAVILLLGAATEWVESHSGHQHSWPFYLLAGLGLAVLAMFVERAGL